MAETFDDDFKSEMLDFKARMIRFAEIAEHKFDGLTADLRSTSIRLEKLEQRIDQLDSKINSMAAMLKEVRSELAILAKQFNTVGSLTIQDHERVNNLERRVADLEAATH